MRPPFVILARMSRFHGLPVTLLIRAKMNHTKKENLIQVPDLELSESMEENLKNEDLMAQIEETCRGWNKQVTGALEIQQKKVNLS